MMDICGQCRWFERYSPESERGKCTRYPAVPMVINNAVYSARPSMSDTDCCGEYAERQRFTH